MQADLSKIVPLFSKEKFEACRYQGESDEKTCARYRWNVALAEALYPGIQGMEVGFRNRIYQCIADVAGPDWLDAAFLHESEKQMITDAHEALILRKKPVTVPLLVAELKFGFWTSLADARYSSMWPKIIKQIFPFMPNTIRNQIEVSRRLNKARRLRNSVFHHRSIWHWHDLPQHHENIIDLMRWMQPDYSALVQEHDRFPAIFANGSEAYL